MSQNEQSETGEAAIEHVEPYINVSNLTFSDGTAISFNPGDVVVFVGPNNAGKSMALRDMKQKLAKAGHTGLVVTSLEYQQHGEFDDLLSWLEGNSRVSKSDPDNPAYHGFGYSVHKRNISMSWTRSRDLDALSNVLCAHLTAEERLKAANPANNIRITSDAPTHPIHYLQADDSKEEKVSGYFKKAFGSELTDVFPRDKADDIKAILRRSSPWSKLKGTGKAGLPSGDVSSAFQRLDEGLRSVGIFVVPVGQLESFDRTTGNHGPKWVNSVLGKDLKADPGLREARDFVSEIYHYIRSFNNDASVAQPQEGED